MISIAYRNPEIYTNVVLEGLYILTGNNIISYFRLAANRIHATATAVDFTVITLSFWKTPELLKLATSQFSAT